MVEHSAYSGLETLSDAQLWTAFKSGNSRAYALIYERHVRLLFNYGSKISGDRDLVKDCIQDLFYHLWQRRENLGNTNRISFYLFKSLRRSLVEKLSKSPESENISIDYRFRVIPSHENELVENQTWEDDRKKLTDALGKLPGRQKEAIYLKFYHNLSFEEIATIMAVNKRSTYKLIHKALHNLQKHLMGVLISLLLIIFLSIP